MMEIENCGECRACSTQIIRYLRKFERKVERVGRACKKVVSTMWNHVRRLLVETSILV